MAHASIIIPQRYETGGCVEVAQRWHWDAKKELALNLMFEGRLSLDKIALKVAVDPRTMDRWVKHPDFQQRLEALRGGFYNALRDATYADKQRRMLDLELVAALALAEFEATPTLTELRPTREGNIVNTRFNAEAVAAFRGALDDIAKEMGERKQQTEHSGAVAVKYLNDWRSGKESDGVA